MRRARHMVGAFPSPPSARKLYERNIARQHMCTHVVRVAGYDVAAGPVMGTCGMRQRPDRHGILINIIPG